MSKPPGRFGRRSFLKTGAGAVVAGFAPAFLTHRSLAAEQVLYVNTWGGSWTEAEQMAFYEPFTKETGIAIRTVKPVSFAKLKAQVQTGNYEWDCSTIGPVPFQQAMNEELVEPIDPQLLERGTIPEQMIFGDGVANMALATCLVYRKDKFENGGPQSWADFWDTDKFPGERSLYNRSFTCLAFALLADGVPKDELYPMDIDRAFRKLDEIKPHIKVWWEQGSQSQQLIRDGEVDMIGMWNARAQELIDDGVPLEIVWNGAESYLSYWYVPKGTPRADLAWQFIEFASQPKPQAEFCKRLPYGPTNPGAFEYIPSSRARIMPTWPEHLEAGVQPDAQWLAPRMPEIRERWVQWLAS